MNRSITIHSPIGDRIIDDNSAAFIIAEMSANHMMDFDRAVKIIESAKAAGADAIKLQTYTPDTITLNCDNKYFQITQGTIWDGTTLHKLYRTAYTPWEWQPKLKMIAEENGLICFSSPFDFTAVDFMEQMDMAVYKVASFEITDIPLIRKIARLNKPIIISTGIAYPDDIELALETCREEGNEDIMLLKCTSAYPSPYEDINLKVIPDMAEKYQVITGLSDHTMGSAVAVGSIPLGAKIIEKHLTLNREDGGPDGQFSMEPDEFREMVENIRIVEKALGKVTYNLTEKQIKSREHSRSLFAVKDIKSGDTISEDNVRSVRPGFGMHTKYYEEIIGKRVNRDIKMGMPMKEEYIQNFSMTKKNQNI